MSDHVQFLGRAFRLAPSRAKSCHGCDVLQIRGWECHASERPPCDPHHVLIRAQPYKGPSGTTDGGAIHRAARHALHDDPWMDEKVARAVEVERRLDAAQKAGEKLARSLQCARDRNKAGLMRV